MAGLDDPRCEPGAYLHDGIRLVCVQRRHLSAGLMRAWVLYCEDAATEQTVRIVPGALGAWTLARAAPSAAQREGIEEAA